MTVDCIGIYAPELIPDKTLIFTYDELTATFDPVTEILKYSGVEFSELKNEKIGDLENDLAIVSESFVYGDCEGLKGRSIKKAFNKALESGYFDYFLNKWDIKRDALGLNKFRGNDGTEYFIEVKPLEFTAKLLFFFAPADLFKIFGRDNYELIRESKLYQFRSLRFLNPLPSKLLYTNKGLVQLNYELRDTMYRLPTVDKSLSGQSKAFKLKSAKIDIIERELSDDLGLNNPNEIMKNMTLFKNNRLIEFLQYNAQDIFATAELDVTQQLFLNNLRADIKLDATDISDTTGKNVSTVIEDLVNHHFNINDDDEIKVIKRLYKLSQGKNLQSISSNHFGIQPFLTVGGLLFSRMSLSAYVEGRLGDLDLKSCYATILSKLNIYFGEPITFTFRYKKYKPTLRDALKLIESEKSPNDAWFIRVSGKLEKAVNTLIMSDLRFKPRRDLIPDKNTISLNRNSIGQFNAEKTSKKQATSTVLLKEVKFGLINFTLLEALKLLPDEWLDEYLGLAVDAIVYIPESLVANSLDEYKELVESLPEEPESEELNLDKRVLITETRHYKNNVSLRFPISEYWDVLRTKRNGYKKAGNPIQEVFKIVQNSGYGAFACMYLNVNNLLASNMITASARAATWSMTYAINGFSPITDGACFSWDTMPIGMTFKALLKQSDKYLNHYDSSIISGLKDSEIGEKWINSTFKEHLASFFEVDINHYLVTLFDYELKTESFLTKYGDEVLKNWIDSLDYVPTNKEIETFLSESSKTSDEKVTLKTDTYNWYVNNNGANYVKGMSESSLLIDEHEYSFTEQSGQIKARSYSSKRDDGLLPWYVGSIKDTYKLPYIYVESQVIKFGEGNDLAIKFLKELDCEIAHPTGFTKQSVKLMKLVSRSQFLFLNESQLRNFETNGETLANLSKTRISNGSPLLSKRFFETYKYDDMRSHIDYYEFSKSHSVGIGFELLALSQSHNGSIQSVRRSIVDKIENGVKDFNASLQVKRGVKNADSFRELLAIAVIKKANYEDDLKNVLIQSAQEPTCFTVSKSDVFTLAKLWGYGNED